MKNLIIAAAMGGLVMTSGCASTGSEAAAPEAVAATPVNLVIMYTLKEGVTPADFEAWVAETDHPTMRGLESVEDFRTYRAEGLLMGEGTPSVTYIETFAISDMEGFTTEDMAGEAVQAITGQFMGFAEAPQFILVTELD